MIVPPKQQGPWVYLIGRQPLLKFDTLEEAFESKGPMTEWGWEINRELGHISWYRSNETITNDVRYRGSFA